jgi:predicted dehydrogenase
MSKRRTFIKHSVILTGGLMTSPEFLFNSSVDNTIKVALVGCGGRGTGAAIQALSTKFNVKLVAMADAFQDRLDKSLKGILGHEIEDANGNMVNFKSKVEVPKDRQFIGFESYKKAIALADVVILATPPGFRPVHFEEAINAGKHVFMEKPVAVDSNGVRRVLAAAEKAKAKKLNVVVGLQRHYQTKYRELMKRLQDGMIGEVVSGSAWWNNDGVWVKPRVNGQTEMEYQMRNWYYFNWLCGDHICEQHIHNIDVINWAKNAYPVKARGTGGREVRNGKDHGEIFDHHIVEFEYADGTILNSQCRHIPGTWAKVDELAIGTKANIKFDEGLIVDHKGKTLFSHDDKNDPNPYQVEHDELFEAISKNEYKFSDAENGAKSTMTSILGRLATYSGQSINWDDALKLEMNLAPATYTWDADMPLKPNEMGKYKVAIPGVTKYIM